MQGRRLRAPGRQLAAEQRCRLPQSILQLATSGRVSGLHIRLCMVTESSLLMPAPLTSNMVPFRSMHWVGEQHQTRSFHIAPYMNRGTLPCCCAQWTVRHAVLQTIACGSQQISHLRTWSDAL